jgi:hypothetical protein
MFWDHSTILTVCVGLILLAVLGWLKYRSDATEQRKSDVRWFAIYAALVVCVGFSVLASYISPREEFDGRVTESHVGASRGDDSYFRVRSAAGQEIRLSTFRNITSALNTTQTVHVIYETWESKPVAIDVVSGDRPGTVLALAEGNRLSALGILIFLAVVVLMVRSAVKLRSSAASSELQ